MEEIQNNVIENKDVITEEKHLTQEQFDKALTKRLEKERKKMLEEFKLQLEEEKRLAKLSEEEKQRELFKKEKLELEKEREALRLEKMNNYTKSKLIEAGLSTDFTSYIVKNSIEDIDAEVEKFKNTFFNNVNNKVEAQLQATAPSTTIGAKTEVEKDSFLSALGL